MITLNTKMLVSALDEADNYNPLQMNKGVEYIYQKIYLKLSLGEDVHLSDIDFSCFCLDDVDAIRELDDILRDNETKVETLMCALNNLQPIVAQTMFI